ncbi:TIGR03808 family TAT-translocated repetitive protein [Tepidamorphus sp. 3E244]|uniref:TIGR03808 family TAT-translocated repetitive protein n=1 Tax=Tepidamorphus sp. 3E244 TaxID=3385498 RepID=UPI0038FC1C05
MSRNTPQTDLARRRALAALTGAGLAIAGGGNRALAGPMADGTSYGIVADNGRDQAPAIAAALTQTAATGATLFLPPGVYPVSALNLPNGSSLAGARGQTVLTGTGAAPLIATAGAQAVSVAGITFDGQLAGGDEPGGAVQFRSASGLRITGCRFTAGERALLQLSGCAGTIEDNLFEKGFDSAIFATDSAGLSITGNEVRDMGDNGILVWRSEAGEDGTIVTGNRITRIGNRSGGNGQYGNGINVYRAGNVIIANNRITDCALSAIRDNAGSNCQIVGNATTRSGETAIFVEFGFTGAVVADNIVEGASTGISVTNFNEGGRMATVTGNVVRDLFRDTARKEGEPQAHGIGIAVEADTIVSANVVENAPWIGISLGYGRYLRGVIASDNVVRGGEYGIAVSVVRGAGTTVVRGNVLSGQSKTAIAGFDHDEAITGDLIDSGTDDYPHLTMSGNLAS